MAQETYYELLYIIDGKAKEEDLSAVSSKVRDAIAKAGGSIMGEESFGVRQFAYSMKSFLRGDYLLVNFEAPSEKVKDLNNTLRHLAGILRHNIVLRPKYFLDEKEAAMRFDAMEKAREASIGEKEEARAAKEPVAVEKEDEGFSMEELDKKLEEILNN